MKMLQTCAMQKNQNFPPSLDGLNLNTSVVITDYVLVTQNIQV